jgi:hypothetical protein
MTKGQEQQKLRAVFGEAPLTEAEIKEIDDTEFALYAQLIRIFQAGTLYRPYPVPGTEPHVRGAWSTNQDDLVVPKDLKIEMMCAACDDVKRSFAVDHLDRNGHLGNVELSIDAGPYLVCFKCTHCSKQRIAVLVAVTRDPATNMLQLEKGGVYPSVRPEPRPILGKALAAEKELLRRGLLSEHAGLGIGAFGYFRRVAELIVDRLLSDLRSFAEMNDMGELVAKVDEARKQQRASDRIAVVVPLVPKILQPNGENPLATIYAALSDGLHGGTDAECLDEAAALRTALEFVLETLESVTTPPSGYLDAIRKVKDADAKRRARAEKQSK